MSDPVTPSTEELQGSHQAPLSMRILQAKILEWVTISSSNLTTVICKISYLKNNILHHNPTNTHTYVIYIYIYKSETKVLPKTSTLHINFLRPLPVF